LVVAALASFGEGLAAFAPLPESALAGGADESLFLLVAAGE
jgi:hypothetical protein